jgi:hypothetical protein
LKKENPESANVYSRVPIDEHVYMWELIEMYWAGEKGKFRIIRFPPV